MVSVMSEPQKWAVKEEDEHVDGYGPVKQRARTRRGEPALVDVIFDVLSGCSASGWLAKPRHLYEWKLWEAGMKGW
jgi:hypothetical protein